jgi:hypothetical protein
MTDQPQAPLADAPPAEDRVTVYDRDHLKLYMRLLDANAEGAPLPEIARILFGIDAEAEPERARWMTEHGYRDLLRHGLP